VGFLILILWTFFRDKIKLKPGTTKRQGDVALLLAHSQGTGHFRYFTNRTPSHCRNGRQGDKQLTLLPFDWLLHFSAMSICEVQNAINSYVLLKYALVKITLLLGIFERFTAPFNTKFNQLLCFLLPSIDIAEVWIKKFLLNKNSCLLSYWQRLIHCLLQSTGCQHNSSRQQEKVQLLVVFYSWVIYKVYIRYSQCQICGWWLVVSVSGWSLLINNG